jgi:hypothetical protein
MTNPTSNFGWQMPTPTDLVTDLPADFEVFGQAVDTSMADLKGGTTGQILSKASNTNMDFTLITNDVGDITAVNVTAPITGGGTSGAVTIGVSAASTAAAGVVQLSDSTSTTSSVLASTPTATKSAYDLAAAAVPKSTVTTAGDVIYATGSAAVTRLGIGTAGQVLAVNSGATAPEWIAAPSGGGMTLLSTTSMSGNATITVSSISGSYNQLAIQVLDYYASSAGAMTLRFNSDSTAAAYVYNVNYYPVDAGSGVTRNTTGYSTTGVGISEGSLIASDNNNAVYITVQNYAESTVRKLFNFNNGFLNAGSNQSLSTGAGYWNNVTAIDSVSIITGAGTWSQGTIKIWGIK